jgi:hypothetical protein
MTRDVGDDPIPAILAALCLRPSARTPHPGGSRFVANKRQSDIQQPYDWLVEDHFSLCFGFDLAD